MTLTTEEFYTGLTVGLGSVLYMEDHKCDDPNCGHQVSDILINLEFKKEGGDTQGIIVPVQSALGQALLSGELLENLRIAIDALVSGDLY